MHKTPSEGAELVKDLLIEQDKFKDCDVVVCPPFTALPAVSETLHNSSVIGLGAQNVHEQSHGAFTGEISAAMLRELYVRYAIIGHSERRQYYCEDDALVGDKTAAALANGLKPIVCIGETLEQREAGEWKQVLETQITGGLSGFSEKEIAEVVIAYEPVWAIGTGVTASPGQAQEAHAHVRSVFGGLYPEAAPKLRIQYGGSVKPDNAKELLGQEDIDGALVGGASLDARSFVAIIKSACQE